MSQEMEKRYGRADLALLKTLDRGRVFEVLRSFDPLELSSDQFVDRVSNLLDWEKISESGQNGHPADRSESVTALLTYAAERQLAVDSFEVPADLRRTAEDVLRGRFTFYGETHELRSPIDWDGNPGTAHWLPSAIRRGIAVMEGKPPN